MHLMQNRFCAAVQRMSMKHRLKRKSNGSRILTIQDQRFLLPMNAQHSPEFQTRIYGLHLIPVSAGVIRIWIYALGIMADR